MAMADVVDPDVDYYPVRKFPDAAPCHGRDEFARFLVRYREAWSYKYTIQDVIGVGDDRVLLCVMMNAEGLASTIELSGEVYHCCWLQDGHIVRLEDHLTLNGALRALGLQGETLEATGTEKWPD
jgi:SnoaL-like domain